MSPQLRAVGHMIMQVHNIQYIKNMQNILVTAQSIHLQ